MLSVLRVILVVPLDSNSVEHERLWNTLSTVSLMNLYKYKGLGLDGLSNVGRVGKNDKSWEEPKLIQLPKASSCKQTDTWVFTAG